MLFREAHRNLKYCLLRKSLVTPLKRLRTTTPASQHNPYAWHATHVIFDVIQPLGPCPNRARGPKTQTLVACGHTNQLEQERVRTNWEVSRLPLAAMNFPNPRDFPQKYKVRREHLGVDLIYIRIPWKEFLIQLHSCCQP